MALGYKELEVLVEKVKEYVNEKIIELNRTSGLDKYLAKIGYTIPKNNFGSHTSIKKQSKILIIGETSIKEDVIYAIFRDAGISKNRLELVLDYDKAEKYNYLKLQYNDNYGVVLFGPIPHSTKNKSSYSSVITMMIDNKGEYPPVLKLEAGSKMKISKSNLQNTIDFLIANDVVRSDLSFN